MIKKTIPAKIDRNILIIENAQFLPGDCGVVRLSAGKIPSGSKLDILAHVFRSVNEGPTLLIIGGIHGDEINGIEIITSMLEAKVFDNILCGAVVAIPLTNVFGFNNLSRDMPDGKDVNRSFPGSTYGSLASRIAGTISKNILPFVDYAIDLHTGGAERYNHPQTRFTKGDEVSKKLSEVFGATFTIQQPLINHSFRKTANDLGIHVVLYEGGEAVRVNHKAINIGIEGIKRVMHNLGMLNKDLIAANENTIHINTSKWIRAAAAGIFIWTKRSGDKVTQGECIGSIKDPYGLKTNLVISKHGGYIIGHNNAAVVNQGDPLFHIGITDEKTGF
jgi:uncharacterized protein